MVRVLIQTTELEKLLTDFNEQEQKAIEDLKEKSKSMMRLEAKLAELKRNKALAKKKTVEDFKSSNEFQEAVITLASAYFGKDFDFCKRQLAYYHPNIGIDLDSMEMDRDLIEREKAKAEEEGNKEKEDE